jgi:hypothetical protein
VGGEQGGPDEPQGAGEGRFVAFLNSLRTEAGAFRVLLWTVAIFLPVIVILVLVRTL